MRAIQLNSGFRGVSESCSMASALRGHVEPHPDFDRGKRSRRRIHRKRPRAFTLIETALATVIIGVGVVAIIDANQAFMRSNSWSSLAATGTLLGNEIRELTRGFPRHDAVTGLFLGEDGNGGSVLIGWGPEAFETVLRDYDDLDDFDGVRFGADGDFPGPIDAFGNIIPQTLPDGTVLMHNGQVVPLEGWSQTVFVEKVNPVDFSQVLPRDFEGRASASAPWRAVDQFPLRVTVVVEYRGPYVREPMEITRVVWIVP